jgi:hypothetical protein
MRRFVMVLLGIGLLLTPLTAVAAPLPAASCENIEGTFIGQAVPTDIGFDVYVVELTGPLGGHTPGTKLVTVTIQKVTPGGMIQFSGIHDFETTDFGPMVTHDSGGIAPNGRAHNTLKVVEGGTGFVSVQGNVDLDTGVISARYHGRVCAQ